MKHYSFFVLAALYGLSGGAQAAQVDAERISEIVKVLASDEFEGRAPGTVGEEKTVPYLVGRFKALGLQPSGADLVEGGREAGDQWIADF